MHTELSNWVEVDYRAICANYAVLKRTISPAKVWAVVKGNAYGHSMIEVAQALQDDAAGFVVANGSDALELRKAGISQPILVVGWVDPASAPELARNHIEVGVFSSANIKELEHSLVNTTVPLRVHLKVETGLGRLGFPPIEIARIKENPHLSVVGVYSHFASVEEANLSHSQAQLERFAAAGAKFEHPVARHMASTASALLLPEARFDFVRVGIGLYGLWPSPEIRTLVKKKFGKLPNLTPALSWKARLIHIGEVPKGGYVGYGCSFRATRATRVGVLALGYAQGLARAYAQGGVMLVAGQRVPIIGRICMDMTMLDLTDCTFVKPGAIVTIIGRDGEEVISADEMATILGTINYEVVTRIPSTTVRISKEQYV